MLAKKRKKKKTTLSAAFSSRWTLLGPSERSKGEVDEVTKYLYIKPQHILCISNCQNLQFFFNTSTREKEKPKRVLQICSLGARTKELGFDLENI